MQRDLNVAAGHGAAAEPRVCRNSPAGAGEPDSIAAASVVRNSAVQAMAPAVLERHNSDQPLTPLLSSEGDTAETGQARGFHGVDHVLEVAAGVGVDDDHWVGVTAGGALEVHHQRMRIARQGGCAADYILPLRRDGHVDLVGALGRLVGLRGRQVDLQLGVLGVGGSNYEKDDRDEQDVTLAIQ